MSILTCLLLLASVSFQPGPAAEGSACMPYAWSDDPATSLFAPAGMVRLESTAYTLFGTIDGSGVGGGGYIAAAGVRLGDFVLGAGGGWVETDGSDTLSVRICGARTVRGDPIGFMEGIFGPSISVGTSLEYTSVGGEGTARAGALSASAGMQFSIFPTIAVGVDVSGLRLAGDTIVERTIGYGVTSIFDSSFRAHLSVIDGRAALGAELGVGDALTVRTGSNGNGWSSGIGLEHGGFRLDWAVTLSDEYVRHYAGLTFVPGGTP